MLQSETTTNDQTDHAQKSSRLPKNIPITYIWYGKIIPEDYLISLSELRYPFQFIRDAQIDRKFTREIMDIEKSDYYRLQYLYEYGGIYSDLDNVIDYQCLMQLLEPYRNGDKVVFMTDGRGVHTRKNMKQMTNNLIFAPFPKMPILRKMLDGVDQKKGKIWNFAGMKYVAKYQELLEVNMDQCVKHIGDWSWYDASNKVLGKKKTPKRYFKEKFIKKKQIIRQNQNLRRRVQNSKVENNKLQNQLKKVTSEYKKTLEQANKLKQKQTQKDKSVRIESQKDMLSQKQNKAQDTKETIKQVVQGLLNENEGKLNSNEEKWTRQKLTMQNEIKQLNQQSENLQYKKNISLFAFAGTILVVLVLIMVGIKLIRKKNRIFNEIQSNERTVSN